MRVDISISMVLNKSVMTRTLLIVFAVRSWFLFHQNYFESYSTLPRGWSSRVAASRSDRQSVSYELVDTETLSYVESFYTCLPGLFGSGPFPRETLRAPLHPTFRDLTNFSTSLSMENLRILVMGDSVAMQMYYMLEMAVGASAANRTVLSDVVDKPGHYSYALSSTANVGAWRITDIFQRANEGNPPPNAKGGGWNITTARDLLSLPDPVNGEPIVSFDVIFFNIPSAWLVNDLPNFNASLILESLQLANEVFGVKKAILLTMPYQMHSDYDSLPILFQKNRDIQSLVTSFQPNHTIPGITGLAMMDYAELQFSMIRTNAAVLGYFNTTNSQDMPYLKVRLYEYEGHRPAALACGGPLITLETSSRRSGKGNLVNMTTCSRNALYADDVHICTDVFGGRIVAATGCLLQCLYDDVTDVADHNRHGDENLYQKDETDHDIAFLGCQKACNDKFMTFENAIVS